MTLSSEEKLLVEELAEAVSAEMVRRKLYSFHASPTVYVNIRHEKLHLTLTDEGNSRTEVHSSTGVEKGVFSFFIARFMLDDLLGMGHSIIESYATDKVNDYVEDTIEQNAYSKNLQRAKKLLNDDHHYAALVMLISAFEVASRDIFFRNNEFWFISLSSPHRDLYERLGVKLETMDEGPEYRIKVHIGDAMYGFDNAHYELLKSWASVRHGEEIFKICKRLGILEEYLQKLYGNLLQEIGFYEILKTTLQESPRRPINFQILDGTGGMKWCYNRFFMTDLERLPNEMRILRESLQKRHHIIHGRLDDSEITKETVYELDATVRRVINYLRDEILTWDYVL